MMFRLATDADFQGRLYWALLRKLPDLDIVRVQEVGLRTAPDPDVLAWTASEGRILLTHDKKTMIKFANERVRAGLPMSGVFLVRDQQVRARLLVESIHLIMTCSSPEEWENRVTFLPF
jgi:predicted nuclease of predicted toxin-antitoxin system